MRSPRTRATVVGSVIAILGGLVTALVVSIFSSLGTLVGLASVVALIGGLVLGLRALVHLAGLGLFSGVVLAGVEGAGVGAVLAGVILAVFTWDVAGNALGLGAHVGTASRTVRVESVHAVATLAVGLGTAVLAFGIFALAVGEYAITTVALFVLAAFLFAALFR